MARILLVDDDGASLELLQRALDADGHQTTKAHSGTEARELLEKAPGEYAVVVTDVNMPGLSGVDLIRAAHTLNGALRFVLISGFIDQLERAKGELSAPVAILAKPFTLDQIRACVRRALET
jgi:two-component system, cell cycle response regulator CpdR